MTTVCSAVVFDAYGTLFDVHSVQARAESLFPGHGRRIAAEWRVRQVDYTRLRSMAGRYAPFSEVTRDALAATLTALGLSASAADVMHLADAYLTLAPFPESRDVLEALVAADVPRVILTNGDRRMIEPLIQASGLDSLIDAVLSADEVGAFKVDPRVYQLGVDHVGVEPSQILFVSANQWDAVGARWFGHCSAWVNRRGETVEELGVRPTYEIPDLRGVTALVSAAA